jgi:hypothetical protein
MKKVLQQIDKQGLFDPTVGNCAGLLCLNANRRARA